MELPLHSPARLWSFLVAIFLVVAALFFLTGKRWRAESLARSGNPEAWLRAAELEPGNAEHWHRLGRFRQYDFERADLPLAITYYERATQRDPGNAQFWMDLASAYEMTGQPALAQSAFERARTAHPISASVAWHFGNFLIRRGDSARGFAEIHRAVETDRTLLYPAVSLCWRASGDAGRLLDEVLPATGDAYTSAVNFFLVQQETQAALAVWSRWVALGKGFDLRPAFSLIELLLRDLRWEDARNVWRKSLQAGGERTGSAGGDSLVWDGGFERGFLNGGFAWRQQSVTGASIGFETGAGDAGSRALRIEFDGTANLDFVHVSQWVLVEPATHYSFRAKLRTREITTDSGIQFLISARRTAEAQNLFTPAVVGTNDWTAQELEFTTGKSTRLVEIILRRAPSRKFDNKLKGTVWVDDVSLEPVSPPRGDVR